MSTTVVTDEALERAVMAPTELPGTLFGSLVQAHATGSTMSATVSVGLNWSCRSTPILIVTGSKDDSGHHVPAHAGGSLSSLGREERDHAGNILDLCERAA
jgi:hypothetical protein